MWAEALRAYKGVLGRDLRKSFRSVDDMVANGVEQMNAFHKWRHNEKKVDKLRSLFMQNVDFIEKGAQHLVDAASPTFPPAAAIGTAMTFILTVRNQNMNIASSTRSTLNNDRLANLFPPTMMWLQRFSKT